MKKEIMSKILVGLASTVVMGLCGLCYNWWKGIDAMPEKMQVMEQRYEARIRRDSLAMIDFFKKQKHEQDSIAKVHKIWLEEDYRSIQAIKQYLQMP